MAATYLWPRLGICRAVLVRQIPGKDAGLGVEAREPFEQVGCARDRRIERAFECGAALDAVALVAAGPLGAGAEVDRVEIDPAVADIGRVRAVARLRRPPALDHILAAGKAGHDDVSGLGSVVANPDQRALCFRLAGANRRHDKQTQQSSKARSNDPHRSILPGYDWPDHDTDLCPPQDGLCGLAASANSLELSVESTGRRRPPPVDRGRQCALNLHTRHLPPPEAAP